MLTTQNTHIIECQHNTICTKLIFTFESFENVKRMNAVQIQYKI